MSYSNDPLAEQKRRHVEYTRRERIDQLRAIQEPIKSDYRPEHRWFYERDLRNFESAQAQLRELLEVENQLERERLAREELERSEAYRRRQQEDEEIRLAQERMAEAKRLRKLAEAREVNAAFESDTFNLDEYDKGRYPSNWDSLRRAAYTRDSYTCQNCGAKGTNVSLHAHHIVPLSRKGTNKISNLVTLCDQCHRAVHGV